MARAIEATVEKLAGAISAVEREVVLIHEYRNRQIADVVTGKVDVREAAAGLPEVGSAVVGNEFGEHDDG